jgi:ribonuclease P protein component
MLPKINRLLKSSEFSRTTSKGERVSNLHLVAYLLPINDSKDLPTYLWDKPSLLNNAKNESIRELNLIQPTKIGFIVNKMIGGSVQRHRVTRQLRHLIRQDLAKLPNNYQIVIRVIRPLDDYQKSWQELLLNINQKLKNKNLVNV